MLLSDSITGTLLTIHETDQIGANCKSLPSRVPNSAKPPIFIDPSEV